MRNLMWRKTKTRIQRRNLSKTELLKPLFTTVNNRTELLYNFIVYKSQSPMTDFDSVKKKCAFKRKKLSMYACVKVCVPRKSLLSQKKVFRLKSTRKNTANYVAAATSLCPSVGFVCFWDPILDSCFSPHVQCCVCFYLGTTWNKCNSCQQLRPFA